MKCAKKAKKKHSSSDKPISCDMMRENSLAGLLEGLIYVLAKEARNRDIDINHEAQCANFDKDLTEYLNQVTREIEEYEKLQDEVEMTADKEAVEHIEVRTQRFEETVAKTG